MEIGKVFISGPMTGYEDFNRKEFMRAEELLRDAGFSVFNPARMDFDAAWSPQDIMAIDLVALSRCSFIYQLPGWKDSKGASAENEAARSMGIKTINKSWLDWYVEEKRTYIRGREKAKKDFLEGQNSRKELAPI